MSCMGSWDIFTPQNVAFDNLVQFGISWIMSNIEDETKWDVKSAYKWLRQWYWNKNLHGVTTKTWQNELVPLWVAAWMATTTRVPTDMMEFLTFSTGESTTDYFAKRLAIWININNWQIVTAFILQVWLNSHDVENFFTWPIFHSPQWRWIAGSVTTFLTCKTFMI